MLRRLVAGALNTSERLILLFEDGEAINGSELIDDVNGIVAMQVMSQPLLLVVNGNQRHRGVKLGLALEEEELAPAQAELRDIARRQNFEGVTPEQPARGRMGRSCISQSNMPPQYRTAFGSAACDCNRSTWS